jgi:TonB family protein
MSRFEKKCLVASAGVHGIVALLLFAGPWIWVSQHQERALPPLTMIPSRLIDGLTSGGGSPTATASAVPAPARAAQQPVLAPPAPPLLRAEPTPPRSRPRRSAEPAVNTQRATRPDDSEDSPDTRPSRHKIELSLTREPGGSGSSRQRTAAETRAEGEANARAGQARFAARLNGVIGAIGTGLSTGTALDVPGPGGQASADYRQYVISVYKQAWVTPANFTDKLATVKVRVVVLRNGTVDSFQIVRRSGSAMLDVSVERLKTVTFIAPFPEGAQDEKRTFIINFNLEL